MLDVDRWMVTFTTKSSKLDTRMRLFKMNRIAIGVFNTKFYLTIIVRILFLWMEMLI